MQPHRIHTIPIEITPVIFLGLNAPVTLVEAPVFHTADVLAGLTMAQLIRPGTPVLFGGAPAAFHMQTATSPMAAIEAQQLIMAYVAVAKHLNLPTQAYMARRTAEGKTKAEIMRCLKRYVAREAFGLLPIDRTRL